MINKYFIILIGLLLLSPITIFAISQGAPLSLLIEPSSRAGAMGSAYVAQVDDAYSGYWNPGAMAFNRKTQIAWMHSNWFGDVEGIDDMYYEYLAWNQYFEDIGNIGFNATFMTFGEMQIIDAQQNDHGTYKPFDMSTAFTYAYQFSQNDGAGITFKIIYSKLATDQVLQAVNASDKKGYGLSWAFDLGYKRTNLFLRGLDFGIILQNIGPKITYSNKEQADPLPSNWRMGFSYRALERQFNKFTVNLDMNKNLANDDSVIESIVTAWFDDDANDEIDEIILNAGAEYVYLDLLSLRGGYISDRAGSIEGFSFGAGIHYTFSGSYKLSLDMAFQPAGELTDYNKTFSAKLDF